MPFWWPDSNSVGYYARGVLRLVNVDNGATRVLAAAPSGRGGAWSRDGIIVFAPAMDDGLYRVPVVGGVVQSPRSRS